MINRSHPRFIRITFYALPLAIILTWWYLAFQNEKEGNSKSPISHIHKNIEAPPIVKYLSPLQRETLHSALSGDYNLMIKLITDWDHDAQIMCQFGFKDIKRLDVDDFLRCQLLARQISSSKDLERLHEAYRLTTIRDDMGNLFDLSQPYRRFLPQSYVAASFLLALTEPDNIIALPRGLREQKNIYQTTITHRVPLDSDRYNTEKLYEAKPDIAFVADYSHPTTIQALKNQGIPLFTLKQVYSTQDIQNALLRMGHIVNRPLEAELLNYFIASAMQAIDNRFKVLNVAFNDPESSPKVLFLKHHLTFSTPTSNTLTGQLLKRIGVQELAGDKASKNKIAWNIPIHQEKILGLDPDYIIIGTSCIDTSRMNILKEPLFQKLSETNKQIAFVDDTIQETPSQYIVLAYYDIFKALTPAQSP